MRFRRYRFFRLYSPSETGTWEAPAGTITSSPTCNRPAPHTHSHSETRLPPPRGCAGQRACQHAQLGIPETAHGPTLEYHQLPHGSSTHSLTRPAGYTGDGSRADSGIPPAASRPLHSLTHTPSWVYRRRLTGRLWNATSCLTAAPLTHARTLRVAASCSCFFLYTASSRRMAAVLSRTCAVGGAGTGATPCATWKWDRNTVLKVQQGFQQGPLSSTGISTGSLKFNRDFNRLVEIQQAGPHVEGVRLDELHLRLPLRLGQGRGSLVRGQLELALGGVGVFLLPRVGAST
jgi:hypothetical protein